MILVKIKLISVKKISQSLQKSFDLLSTMINYYYFLLKLLIYDQL